MWMCVYNLKLKIFVKEVERIYERIKKALPNLDWGPDKASEHVHYWTWLPHYVNDIYLS